MGLKNNQKQSTEKSAQEHDKESDKLQKKVVELSTALNLMEKKYNELEVSHKKLSDQHQVNKTEMQSS